MSAFILTLKQNWRDSMHEVNMEHPLLKKYPPMVRIARCDVVYWPAHVVISGAEATVLRILLAPITGEAEPCPTD